MHRTRWPQVRTCTANAWDTYLYVYPVDSGGSACNVPGTYAAENDDAFVACAYGRYFR